MKPCKIFVSQDISQDKISWNISSSYFKILPPRWNRVKYILFKIFLNRMKYLEIYSKVLLRYSTQYASEVKPCKIYPFQDIFQQDEISWNIFLSYFKIFNTSCLPVKPCKIYHFQDIFGLQPGKLHTYPEIFFKIFNTICHPDEGVKYKYFWMRNMPPGWR